MIDAQGRLVVGSLDEAPEVHAWGDGSGPPRFPSVTFTVDLGYLDDMYRVARDAWGRLRAAIRTLHHPSAHECKRARAIVKAAGCLPGHPDYVAKVGDVAESLFLRRLARKDWDW